MAAGSIAFAACNNTPSYTVKGIAAGVEDGETVYLQEQKGRELISLDSAIVKNGSFTFTGRQDTTVIRYITYLPGELWVDFFLENGKITVDLTEEKAGGTANNDIYQAEFKDYIATMNQDLGTLYNQLRTDSTLTEEQRQALTNQIEAKNDEAMGQLLQTIEKNITNPVGDRRAHV